MALLVIFLLAKPIKNRQYCAHICTCAIQDKQHSYDIALAAGVISLIMCYKYEIKTHTGAFLPQYLEF